MKLVFIILFSLTALGGAYLASFILTNKNPPKVVAMMHGGFAVLGLILLMTYSVLYSGSGISIILFIMAAMGGFIIFSKGRVGKVIPKPLIVGHGLLALVGLAFLILWGIN